MDIRPGTKLNMTIESRREWDVAFVLNTIFETQLDDRLFVAALPIYKNAVYPLHAGELLYLYYFDRQARHDFQAVVENRFKEDGLYYFKARRTTEILKTQRREDFRLDLTFPFLLDILNDAGKRDQKQVGAMMIDLSGGGFSARVSRYLDIGDRIAFKLYLEDIGQTLSLKAETRWTSPAQSGDEYRYVVGFRFLHSEKKHKEMIVQYLFRQQQQRMRIEKLTPLDPYADDFL